jgi:purine-cytosine permease-like protein
MKNNALTTILLAVLAVTAIWSAILCVQYLLNKRELGAMEGEAAEIANHENIDQAILNEAVLYSTNHPAINPVLEALSVKKPAPAPVATTPAPAPKPSAR